MSESSASSTSSEWLQNYRPAEGVYDELLGSGGTPRPQWQLLLSECASLGKTNLHERWQQAQREIEKNGVTYNPYEDAVQGKSRPWILDPVPLILTDAESEALGDGVRQRAELFELIVRDLFGPQRLLHDRALPPDVFFAQSKYNLAYHNLQHHPAPHLYLYAADVSRAADGAWWVTGNRTRAPLGLGYLVENRLMTSQLLGKLFRDSGVYRVAPFFEALQEALREAAPRNRENPRVVVWSKGPKGPSYFEDAYLARYLGYTLAEGGDLAVRNNRVKLKTLGGLLPVEVLLRRLEDEETDSVELASSSTKGISGLLEVLRAGNVAVANALGTNLVESPILSAFLPSLCTGLLGEDLKLPSVATWWCGEAPALAYVLDHLDGLCMRPAFGNADSAMVQPGQMPRVERDAFVARLKAEPQHWVGQEAAQRSLTPAWSGDGLVPWYLALRTYAVRSGNSYTTLKGGLARVSPDMETLNREMTAGERSQDVWVLASKEVAHVSLLPPRGSTIALRRSGEDLPSRVADDLYWLGRSMERAEGLARFLRVAFRQYSGEGEAAWKGAFIQKTLLELRQDASRPEFDPEITLLTRIHTLTESAMYDDTDPSSLRSSVNEALRLASGVRDRIAVDMWHSVGRVDRIVTGMKRAGNYGVSALAERLDALLFELTSFSGIASESMTRTEGWRFLDLGRRIERAAHTSQLLQSSLVTKSETEPLVLEMLLHIADSIMTYRTRYLATLQVAPVLDLLLTDEANPRSVGYQLARIAEHVDALPRDAMNTLRGPDQVLALSMISSVRLADVYKLSESKSKERRERLYKLLDRIIKQLPQLSQTISGQYLIHAGLARHFGVSGPETR